LPFPLFDHKIPEYLFKKLLADFFSLAKGQCLLTLKLYIMKIFSTKVHGVLDYLMGIVLIASPWLFNFADNTAAQWVPIVLGIAMIVMSLCTNYELGAVRVISMRTHLIIDVIQGLFLAASPWLFGFSEEVYLPHLILGIAEVGAGLMTETVPQKTGASPTSRNTSATGFNVHKTGHAH
jgi:hypothetical protein